MNVATSPRLIVLVSASAGLLALGGPAAHAVRSSRHPRDWLLDEGGDGAAAQLAAAALWCVCLWLALAVLATLLVGLPGAAGACADRLSGVLVPVALRGLLGVGLGTGVALAGATAAHASAPPLFLPAPVAPSHALATLAWAPVLPGDRVTEPDSYVVRPGDSLWSIAARCAPGLSDEQLAVQWQRWYSANKRVVGSDPARIVPGQTLHNPGPAGRGVA